MHSNRLVAVLTYFTFHCLQPELQPWEAWDGLGQSQVDSNQSVAADKRDAVSYSSRDTRQLSSGKQKLSQVDKPFEEEMDFFQDMAPRVIRNAKVMEM